MVWFSISSVQSLNHVWLLVTPWTNARLPYPSLTPEHAQTHVHWVSDAIQPSHALSSPSIFPSIRVFSNESALPIRWPKYWSFSFSISPSNEYSGLISFRIDWVDSLQSKGLPRVFSNTTSKASIIWCSVFLMVQLSQIIMFDWFLQVICHSEICNETSINDLTIACLSSIFYKAKSKVPGIYIIINRTIIVHLRN